MINKLLLVLFMPIAAVAGVTPVEPGPVNGNPISPTTISAQTGSFSGSVTASSITAFGDAKAISVNFPTTSSYGRFSILENGANLGIVEGIGTAFATVNRRGDLAIVSHITGDVTLNPDGGARVGVGLHNPAAMLTVSTATLAAPETSGSARTGAALRVMTSAGSALDFGQSGADPFAMWIQASDPANLASNTTLVINPNGGKIGIGTLAPCTTCTLHVAGDASIVGGLGMGVRTKAQFDAATGVVGQAWLCSNCTIPYSVCVGTGATLSGWKVSHSATVGCGTNN